MKKIPTIFKRKLEDSRQLTREVHPDCDWVFRGEGIAMRKYDGTCVAIINGIYYKRRTVARDKKTPQDFIEIMYDSNTGKRIGWLPVSPGDLGNKYHIEAYKKLLVKTDGTYELCGPKVQGNPEGFNEHRLIKHSEAESYNDCPRDYDGLKDWLSGKDVEGIVFRCPDGRMAKIKKRDFGLER